MYIRRRRPVKEMFFAVLMLVGFTLIMVLNERGPDESYKRIKKPLKRPPARASHR